MPIHRSDAKRKLSPTIISNINFNRSVMYFCVFLSYTSVGVFVYACLCVHACMCVARFGLVFFTTNFNAICVLCTHKFVWSLAAQKKKQIITSTKETNNTEHNKLMPMPPLFSSIHFFPFWNCRWKPSESSVLVATALVEYTNLTQSISLY